MISDNLQALAGTLEKYRTHGLMLEPEGVCRVLAILNALTADAAAMEALIVPATGRVDLAALPENVVAFARRDPSFGPQTGDAA